VLFYVSITLNMAVSLRYKYKIQMRHCASLDSHADIYFTWLGTIAEHSGTHVQEMVTGLLNNLPLLMIFNFVNNLLITSCLKLNSCALTLYVNCLTHKPLPSDHIHAGRPIHTMPHVIASEVSKLLTSLSSKYSTL